jgi:hypothetical protein
LSFDEFARFSGSVMAVWWVPFFVIIF